MPVRNYWIIKRRKSIEEALKASMLKEERIKKILSKQ